MADKKFNIADYVKPSKNVVVCENVTMHQTKSGLSLPNTENKPETGRVIAFGTGDKPVEFKAGDVIAYRRYTDNRVFIHGKELNFIRFSTEPDTNDVLGIIKE